MSIAQGSNKNSIIPAINYYENRREKLLLPPPRLRRRDIDKMAVKNRLSQTNSHNTTWSNWTSSFITWFSNPTQKAISPKNIGQNLKKSNMEESSSDPLAKVNFCWKNLTVSVKTEGWRNKKVPKTLLDNGEYFLAQIISHKNKVNYGASWKSNVHTCKKANPKLQYNWVPHEKRKLLNSFKTSFFIKKVMQFPANKYLFFSHRLHPWRRAYGRYGPLRRWKVNSVQRPHLQEPRRTAGKQIPTKICFFI